jgi:hypothetical protein
MGKNPERKKPADTASIVDGTNIGVAETTKTLTRKQKDCLRWSKHRKKRKEELKMENEHALYFGEGLFTHPCSGHIPYVNKFQLSFLSTHHFGVHVVQAQMGWSLQASKPFPKGAFITQYCGHYLTEKEVKKMPEHERTHIFGLRSGQYIDGMKEPKIGIGAASFANHHPIPNSYFDRSHNVYGIFLRAKVDIKRGNWIMVNYKTTLGHNSYQIEE